MRLWAEAEREYWDGGSSPVPILTDPDQVEELAADAGFTGSVRNESLLLDILATRILAGQRSEGRVQGRGDSREAWDWLTPMQMKNRRRREVGSRDQKERDWFLESVQVMPVYRGSEESRHFGNRGIGSGRYERPVKFCSDESCDRKLGKSSGRGLCALHYTRWRRARVEQT